MQLSEPSSRDQLIWAWLRSEWERVPPPRPASRQLIDRPDFEDAAENATRLELLNRDRRVILEPVPSDVDYFWVGVEAADLACLYVIPCREWYLDTGGSFRLADTAANLAGGRSFRWGALIQPIDHLASVEALAPKLLGYNAAKTDEVLILIAADKAGPYTIIDGTNRAAALYRNYLTRPNLPWRGLLAVGPAMARCEWHIESDHAQANKHGCRELQMLGALR